MKISSLDDRKVAEIAQDISRSGLTDDDAKTLKFELLTNQAFKKLVAGAVITEARAYKIPYFEIDGSVAKIYARYKILGDATLRRTEKPIKYYQPPRTAIRAYLPPYIQWAEIVDDVKKPLIITEGEKKAAITTKSGVPTIGLGGVWSWKSAKRAQALIADLERFKWQGRMVTLIFDTDPVQKPQVTGALEALGHELELRGASVARVTLPPSKGVKVGLDDYLLTHTIEDLRKLVAMPLHLASSLEGLNTEFVLIDSPPSLFHITSQRLFTTPKPLVETTYASRTIQKLTASGNLVEANALNEWCKWPGHRTATRLVYEPGKPQVLEDGAHNMWKGLAVEPVKGDTKKFDRLLDYIFGDDTTARTWFLQWLAYPLIYMGTKLYTAVVMHSCQTGVGKTLLGMTKKTIYGDNFAQISEFALH